MTNNDQVKLRATLFGSGYAANLTMPVAKFQELKAQNKLSHRANISRDHNNMWFNGSPVDLDALIMQYGKENI